MGDDPAQDIAIKVEGLYKSFKLPHQKHASLKSVFLSSFQRKTYEIQRALKDINFDIKKGEFFGIVGRNGSGKSTLLKLIAGIYTPDAGTITVNGSLTPFIELGVGFNPELTGRENVYLNGALLGLSRKDIDSMYDDIVEFAELKRFMDQKLKNYSSGMQVRLAFSISIRAHSDILLLDEVLAVGDSAFQQKCFDYFASLKRDKKTIILVSHGMATIEQFCDRALLLEANEVKHIGTSSKVAGLYEDMILKEEAEKKRHEAQTPAEKTEASKIIEIVKVTTWQGDKRTRSIEAFKDFRLEVTLKSSQALPSAAVGVNIRNSQGQTLFSIDTYDQLGAVSLKKNKTHKISIDIDNIFTNGIYYVNVAVYDPADVTRRKLGRKRNTGRFSVYGVRLNVESLVHPKSQAYFE